MRAGAWIAVAALAGLGACGRLHLPDITPVPKQRAEIADRVWLRTDESAAPGSFVAFLSDGTMIQDSCGETWRLSPWRRVDPTTLVWEEDGKTIRAEIALLGPDTLVLVLDLDDAPVSESFRLGKAPKVCPETR
ncbi:MAG: hypothetical protein U1E34_08890 [Amaricoccus sp.]